MYVREVDGKKLTLQVSGKLWIRSLVMRDLETGTEWAHLLGQAMAGPLKGKKLKPVITDMVTWSVWKQQHPNTTALHLPRSSTKYSRDFYRDPSQFVFGFEVNGTAMALPMSDMLKHPLHQFQVDGVRLLATHDKEGAVTHLFEPATGEQRLDFVAMAGLLMKDRQTGSQWEMLTGRCVKGELKGSLLKQRVGIMSYRATWQRFHPDSKDVEF